MKVKYQESGVFVIQCNDCLEEAFQGTEEQAKERTEELRAQHFLNINRFDPRITLEDYGSRYTWRIKEVDLTAPEDA